MKLPFLPGILIATTLFVEAGDWQQFRGPNASGVADSEKPPIVFSQDTNLIFKVDLPSGASSPVIAGDRIFLTTFNEPGLKTLCLDRHTGKVIWEKKAPAAEFEKVLPGEGNPASATPATDGKQVVVYFGSCGLYNYDLNGNLIWSIPMAMAEQVGDFGSGTSPIIYDGRVYLNRDMAHGSYLVCYDLKTAGTLWKADRSSFASSWSTPIIWNRENGPEVVVAGFLRMTAYDAQTGKEHWEIPGLPGAVCTTPVLGDDMLFYAGWSPGGGQLNNSGPTFASLLQKYDKNSDQKLSRDELDGMLHTIFAIWDIDGNGQMTEQEYDKRQNAVAKAENSLMAIAHEKNNSARIEWKETPKGLPYVPSPLFYRDRIYLLKDGGLLSCFDARNGKALYQTERLGALGNYYSSPVAADGRIYTASLNGMVSVIKAGDTMEVLARNNLGERISTTPAIYDNKLYIRSANHLWAFGEK